MSMISDVLIGGSTGEKPVAALPISIEGIHTLYPQWVASTAKVSRPAAGTVLAPSAPVQYNQNTPLATSAPIVAQNNTLAIPPNSSAPVVQPVLTEVATVTPLTGSEIPNTAAAGVAGAVVASSTGPTIIEVLIILGLLLIFGGIL
jgi:hypothetical protein